MAAGDLIAGFSFDPTQIPQGGVGADSRVVLILRTDMASYTANGIDTVTAVTLAANKSGFAFDGVKQSLKPKWVTAKTDSGLNLFKHQLEFTYFAYDQVARNNAARMTQGRYIMFWENSRLDANAHEIFGIDVGLECVSLERDPQAGDGGMKISFATPDKELEQKPPRIFDAGTGIYATNRTAVDAFLFLPTIGASGLSITTYPAVTPTAIVITGTNYFGGGSNSAVLRVDLVNNATGSIIPVTAALTVASTTITTTTPATGEGSGKNYKVRVTTTKGIVFSAQNVLTT